MKVTAGMTPVTARTRLPGWSDVQLAAFHSAALAVACFVSYWLTTHVLARIHIVSSADTDLGGMWAVIATVFVYRTTYDQSTSAALTRISATSLSLVLRPLYLLLFSFHPLGLAALIGMGTLALTVIGRSEDVVTAGITTAVVLVVAALSPHNAWVQRILRFADTAVGIVVGLAAAWTALRLKRVTPLSVAAPPAARR
jgi:uncharacterized membrane protein YccC